ncbi:geranylgeranyl diphosphate synthase type I [Prauserella shujinwangii]|uniref:Geranylgeranyl diphosphate synthase type I n=1 Tax=Prauserella shujinwangii TaxID=1453103 RepID=A0A2T0LSI2_9PSEU|nr:polyprenyl synthetase family protein [Prauserella shujinwangii]PRX46631.1 geranylgeranyl diphosphate synthase type I [Prauserella shujinwangii]
MDVALKSPEDGQHPAGPGRALDELHQELARRWAGADALDSICRYAVLPAGKLFRPILLLNAAACVGGRAEEVLPAAVGTECGHVASLVHDDIIDRDEMRRGRFSVQHAFGADDAIIAGDALIFDLFGCLAECRATGIADERIVSALAAVSKAGLDMCRGQHLESRLQGRLDCTVETYLEMVSLKTAAFFRAACACGGILGGGEHEQIRALCAYGDHLGVAFQIHDDLLAYTSATTATGKPADSDVRNRRLTLPVILGYRRGGSAAAELKRIMTGAVEPEQAFGAMARLLGETGAIAAAGALANEQAVLAYEALAALPDSPHRTRLAEFAWRAVERTW